MAEYGNRDGLLRIKDVAEILNIGVRTAWRKDSAGTLPAPVKVGLRAKRWRRGELFEWIDAGCPNRQQWEASKGRRR